MFFTEGSTGLSEVSEASTYLVNDVEYMGLTT